MAEQNYYITAGEGGSVNIGEDVFLRIVSATVEENEAVAGFTGAYGTDLAELIGKKTLPKGIDLRFEEDGGVRLDVVIQVRYGNNVAKTAETLQEQIHSAVEAMTGIECRVNVHVTGISFEKAEIK